MQHAALQARAVGQPQLREAGRLPQNALQGIICHPVGACQRQEGQRRQRGTRRCCGDPGAEGSSGRLAHAASALPQVQALQPGAQVG